MFAFQYDLVSLKMSSFTFLSIC